MRTTLLGTLLLFSTLAPCRGYAASSVPACVSDCRKTLAEHGLLTHDMKSTCATPKLQRAHFQCLINICSPGSYGRALAYSVSTCSDTGVNIIPLHPIEVHQPPKHARDLQDEVSDKIQAVGTSMTLNQDFDLGRSFAFALACNTGHDGVVTVSLGQPQPAATALPMAHNKDVFSANGFMTTVLGSISTADSTDKAILMDGSCSAMRDLSTDYESSNGSQRTTIVPEPFSTAFTTQTKNTPCSSDGSLFGGNTPTSTISGTKDQGTFPTMSGTQSSTPCTTSNASGFEGGRGSSKVTSGTESNSRTSDSLTSSCTSSTSRTEGSSDTWRSEDPSGQTTPCSSGGRSSTPTSLRPSTQESWTSDLQSWGTSRLSDSDAPCSSDSSRSNGIISQTSTSTATSTTSWPSSLSTSCTDSSRASSISPASAGSASCSSSSGTGTSRGQFETASTSNTLSITSSSTFTTPSSSEGNIANPAAYTFASPSLPPAYVPPLEEYGYGNPPPVYGFPSQGNGGGNFLSSGSSYPMSSATQQSSSSSRRQNGEPSVYGINTATPTQMAQVAPAHTIFEDDDGDTFQDSPKLVKVTLISSVSGEGMQTTIITVNQGQATSLAMPSVLALNSPGNKQNSTTTNEDSESGIQKPVSGDSNITDMGFETPMPAMFSGGSIISPRIYVLMSTVLVAVGFAICIL